MNQNFSDIVIVGAGLAGAEAAYALREYGYERRIVMLGREPWMPYDRPPLSKAFLKGTHPREQLWLRPEAMYAAQSIELRLGVSVEAIDRAARRVLLAGGESVSYGQLILATGGEARRLPITGVDLDGVKVLKTLDDAENLLTRLAKRPVVVIIGGGYVGMEFAATASLAGCDVTLVEDQPRVLSRSLSPIVACHLQSEYKRRGVKILTQARAVHIGGKGRVQMVELGDGRRLPADLVLISIGNRANDTLAGNAGIRLAEGGGILVDRDGKTNDPDICAAGDCAARPYDGLPTPQRLESVQSAVAQARRVSAVIAGKSTASEEVPWFWSDQFDIKLQMAGLPRSGDVELVRGDTQSGRFSVIYQNAELLTSIQCVNSPADFAAARKMIAQQRRFASDLLCSSHVPMRDMLRDA
ncbi:hypothetical protein M218_04645 [Burkholderia pseudomallei MSHR338]|uniref:NAD(P)/FAD-dependent oxidoreductase n=1 Tax=Burkholderia pseudomallei TaxID=28450 RepID=UPI0003AC7E60|nr:FAD-dependent oxidoreductase [Burkholderia pseudomallei]AIP11791.1 rhodocoxin reductase [Burkholderia pseudomallei]EQA90419.1 hypothetical protein M218_04645 [Burkholderia pseudomallei MSHR338]OMW31610.1 hypothetical protein AQ807_12860 [Burkholderia pseudomallei]ONA26206.1 hypothetical protein AQ879_09045 [Burkholderia pseudomallei]ONA35445.1 hypothetical protein AQ880_01705 [Burkholderia pseudomallei]